MSKRTILALSVVSLFLLMHGQSLSQSRPSERTKSYNTIRLAETDAERGRREREEQRRRCEATKANGLALCLNGVSSEFSRCENGCNPAASDAFTCRDRCRATESTNRTGCHNKLSSMIC